MLLLVTRKYPPAVGGMETLSYQLTRRIAERRPCRILAPHGVWGGPARFVVYAIWKTIALACRGDVELIHLGDPILAPLGYLVQRVFNIPVVCNAHGLDIIYPHRLYQASIIGAMKRLRLVICISNYARDECLARGVPATRCVVIPPGIAAADFAVPAGAPQVPEVAGPPYVMLTVGRLVRRKGVLDFVRHVLPQVAALRRDWEYWVAGEGPDGQAVLDECRRLGLESHVKLLGAVADDELKRLYQRADLFVMPNIPVAGDAEGFGIVILEARAAGLPVIATRLEGISDAWAGADGALISAYDCDGFARAIVAHLARPTAEDRERRRSQVRVAFDWAVVVGRYLEVFDALAAPQRVLQGRRRRSAPADEAVPGRSGR
jgi:glycosyltransferase involved in cell wall biosynthesis